MKGKTYMHIERGEQNEDEREKEKLTGDNE